jgi:hypothetical protein
MRKQTAAMFHAANVAFNAKQREAYNEWIGEVSLAYHLLADALEAIDVPTLKDNPDKDKVYERLQALKKLISMAPNVMLED